MKINVTNERLLEVSRSEQALMKLYEDIKFNRFRADFFQANGERLKTAKSKEWKIIKEFFVTEVDGDKGEIVKTEKVSPTPKVEAVYKTEVVRKKTWFKKEITKQVLVTKEVPEKKNADKPVLHEGKTMEEFEKAYDEFKKLENIMEV